jgi:hypothetical protein
MFCSNCNAPISGLTCNNCFNHCSPRKSREQILEQVRSALSYKYGGVILNDGCEILITLLEEEDAT